jgi:hypothetical protein
MNSNRIAPTSGVKRIVFKMWLSESIHSPRVLWTVARDCRALRWFGSSSINAVVVGRGFNRGKNLPKHHMALAPEVQR